MFSENDLEYEEMKEYANDIYEITKQKEVNYEYRNIEEANYVKIKPYFIEEEQIIGDAVKLKIKMSLDMKKTKC